LANGRNWHKIYLEQLEKGYFMLLAPKGTTTITLAEPHDPDAFYRTGSGLYVRANFRSKVVSLAKPSQAGATYKVAKADLTRHLADREIEGALPENHLFDETELCAIIAGLILRQSPVFEGELLNDGNPNLFYTRASVAAVHRSIGGRRWRLSAWKRDFMRWDAGSQTFSPPN
jgi:hypothetical protein